MSLVIVWGLQSDVEGIRKKKLNFKSVTTALSNMWCTMLWMTLSIPAMTQQELRNRPVHLNHMQCITISLSPHSHHIYEWQKLEMWTWGHLVLYQMKVSESGASTHLYTQTAFFILAHARQKQWIVVQKPILLVILQDTVN